MMRALESKRGSGGLPAGWPGGDCSPAGV